MIHTQTDFRVILLALVTLLSAGTSALGQESTAYRLEREIQIPEIEREEIVVVPFDTAVFAATQEAFPDVRVVGPADLPVPFVLRRISEKTSAITQRTWTVTDPVLHPLTEGGASEKGLEITFILRTEDPQPTGIRLITPLRDFEQRVQVFGIDGDRTQLLVEDALIFDYSRFMDVSRNQIPLPSNSFRKYRVVVDALTSDQESQLLELTKSIQGGSESGHTERTTLQRRPFRIDRIELWTETAEQSLNSNVVTPWPAQKFEVTEDAQKKQTIITLTTRREPVTEFRLKTTSYNFSRHVSVQVPSEQRSGTDWTELSTGTVSRFQLRSMQQEHLNIRVSEVRSEAIRLVIDNRDSPPLQIEGADVLGHNYEVAFMASSGLKYRLQYSSNTERPPEHDTAALVEAFHQGILPITATIGPETPTSAAGEAERLTLTSILNNRYLLGVVIGILVVLFGWGLYQASLRIENVPRDDA